MRCIFQVCLLLTSYSSITATALVSQGTPDTWTFVSMPDFLNVDTTYPQPGWEEAIDGSLLWQAHYAAPATSNHGTGMRATPCVDENRVYTFGRSGDLVCWNLSDGTRTSRTREARRRPGAIRHRHWSRKKPYSYRAAVQHARLRITN